MTPAQNLPAGILDIIARVENLGEYSPAIARQILDSVDLTASDLEPWADFEHPPIDSYGRKIVHDGGFFELMVMSWIDGDMAAIHDHGAAEWGAVRTFGQIEHAVFAIRDGQLTTRDRRALPAGSVLAVSHEMIHQMGNSGQEPYVTLHLYGCYGRDGGVTADARLYDFDTNRIEFTDGGVFFHLPEEQIKRYGTAPATDFATRLRFKVELLRRLITANDSLRRGQLQSEREQRLARELFAASTWKALADEMNEPAAAREERGTDILRQELRAAASVQAVLLAAGLVEASFDRGRLAELLGLADLADFADGYLHLLARAYALDFPLPAVV